MKVKKISIIIKTQVEGIHNFPDAEKIFPEVSFLKYPHRHTFHIECEFLVSHTNRNKEFIITKREINDYLNANFYDIKLNCLDFKGMSCEDIAVNLFDKFQLESCLVGEDDEFFSKVVSKNN